MSYSTMSYERYANESEDMTKLQQAIDRIEQKIVNSQIKANGKARGQRLN